MLSGFDWRRGRGWFRVWVLLSVVWYVVAAYLIATANFERQVQLVERAEFRSEEAQQAHVARVRGIAAESCIPGTVQMSGGSYETWGLGMWDEIEIGVLKERGALKRTLPPSRRIYYASKAVCTDRYETARTAGAAVAALVTPFAAIIVVVLAFYLLRIGATVGRLGWGGARSVGAWLTEGFQAVPQDVPNETESAGPTRLLSEFWREMKPVLKVAPITIVAAWVIFSISTGVRGSATIQTLVSATVATALLLILALVARLLGIGQTPDAEASTAALRTASGGQQDQAVLHEHSEQQEDRESLAPRTRFLPVGAISVLLLAIYDLAARAVATGLTVSGPSELVFQYSQSLFPVLVIYGIAFTFLKLSRKRETAKRAHLYSSIITGLVATLLAYGLWYGAQKPREGSLRTTTNENPSAIVTRTEPANRAAPAAASLDSIITFKDPAECEFSKRLDAVFDNMTDYDDEQGKSIPAKPLRVPGYTTTLTPTFERDDEKNWISSSLPLAGIWNGLRVSRLVNGYWENSHGGETEIRFFESPERVRQVLNGRGFQLPPVGQSRDTTGGDDPSGYGANISVKAVPGGAALVCSSG